MTLEELEQTQRAANRAYWAAKGKYDLELGRRLAEARVAIMLEMKPMLEEVERLRRLNNETEQAIADERVRLAKENTRWPAGAKVERPVYSGGSVWEKRKQVGTEYGIVEVVTANTQFPGNIASYRRPYLGSLIVRLCKKDGTVGLKFETLGDTSTWRVCKEKEVGDAVPTLQATNHE